jgi:hypothetical protein
MLLCFEPMSKCRNLGVHCQKEYCLNLA